MSTNHALILLFCTFLAIRLLPGAFAGVRSHKRKQARKSAPTRNASVPRTPARSFVYRLYIHPQVKAYKWFGDIVPRFEIPIKGKPDTTDAQVIILTVRECDVTLFLATISALRKMDNCSHILDLDLTEIR